MTSQARNLFGFLTSFFIVLTGNIHAQEYFSISQEDLLDLASNASLRQKAGWKWQARRLVEIENRIDLWSNRSVIDPMIAGIHDHQSRKAKARSKQRDAIWLPVGPDLAPPPNNPQYISGTGRINCITFHPTDEQTMWIGGGQGGVWKTSNGGKSWIPLGDDLPVMRISDIAFNPANPDELYISLGDYAYIGFGLSQNDRKRNFHFGLGVYKSEDGGKTWNPTGLMRDLESQDLSLTRRVFVQKSDAALVLAAGTRGIWISENDGASFQQINNRMYWDIEQHPENEQVFFASTAFIRTIDSDHAALWKSEDFGQTWTKLNTGIPEQDTVQRIEIGISPIDPDVIFLVAAGMDGGLFGIYRSTDGGINWELRATQPNILHWFDGSGSGGQGTYDLAILPDPHNIDRLYISGVNHWISEDGGKNWQGASHWVATHGPSVHADHHQLKYNPLDEQYYLCHDGGISRTKALIPGSWQQAQSDTSYQWPTLWEHLNNSLANFSFYRLGLSSDITPDIFAGAQDLGTFLRRDQKWSYNILGDGMECAIHPQQSNIIYGSAQFGNIYRSSDGGTTIERIGVNQPNWQSEFASWTTPFKLDENNPDLIYVPASNVWLSEDGGDNFEPISNFENLFPITGFAVAKSNPNMMYVGKRVWYGLDQPGQILRTVDGGNSWNDITSGLPDDLIINYIDVDDDDPLHVWMVFGSYSEGRKVFESFDGGDTWINISLNLPNLPANCVVHHDAVPGNPVYVGMDRGIYYKNDDMQAWELYGAQLPNVIISELEIHAPSQQIFAATFGRGIWRAPTRDRITSSVWQSVLNAGKIQISPNPNSGKFILEVENLNRGPYQAKIVNVLGQIIWDHSFIIQSSKFYKEIDLDALSGMYYLILSREDAQRSQSFLITDP